MVCLRNIYQVVLSTSKIKICIDDGRCIIYADAFTLLLFCAAVDALRRTLMTCSDHWAAQYADLTYGLQKWKLDIPSCRSG